MLRAFWMTDMPELPEVETTRRGIEPHLVGRTVQRVLVRERRLRWPVPQELSDVLIDCRIQSVHRRAKYLLVDCGSGHLILHLGMTGSLRLVTVTTPPARHDHLDIVLDDGHLLRFRDPRRFGAVLWTTHPPGEHTLIANLGPEPLGPNFDGNYLYALSRGRKAPIKTFIMNARVVVGVGNIYANEALYLAGIRPTRAVGRISRERYLALARAIKEVLEHAIALGGTTLRDFVDSAGNPGYFRQELQVYGRGGGDCLHCGVLLREVRLGQRSTVFCPRCQR